jgi:tellurite methyltransferase
MTDPAVGGTSPAPPEHWPRYYEVTVDRPPWKTVLDAIARFETEDAAAGAATRTEPRLAVDLGCGAGRDARELLRRGWRVLAIDKEPQAVMHLRAATPPADLQRLSTSVEDLGEALIAPCDLVNASISLPFLDTQGWAHAWDQIRGAVKPGGRVAAMLFGDRDQMASEPGATCPSPDAIRLLLDGFEIELWDEREEDGQTALGDPHHWHIIELVARRPG